MSNQILLITEPDDIQQDGIRLLFVNLNNEQTAFVSDCLTELEQIPTVIIYIWNTGNTAEWLLDKKQKSNMVLFNADSQNDLVNGYLAAQSNSFYLGTLRMFNKANVNQINSTEQLTDIFLSLFK